MTRERIFILIARKLTNEATPAEVLELDDLLKEHPQMALVIQYIKEFWQIPVENDKDFLEATFHLHTQQLKKDGYDLEIDKPETGSLNLNSTINQQGKKKWLWASLAVAIAAIITFFSFFNKTTAPTTAIKEKLATSEVSTKNGSRSKLQLPDGTLVWLNSSSKLVYDNSRFGKELREVSLVGEAYFDVVKNPVVPFIIHTVKMDIKVLGTAFNVKCYPEDKTTETSLIRGSIEVTLKDRAEKIKIKPNEKLIINNFNSKINTSNFIKPKQATISEGNSIIALKHLTLFPKDSSIVETSWVENRLVFSDETLEDIAKKMERWYGVTIKITNDKLQKELLTGSFENENIYQALNALQLTTAFVYKIDKNVIIISK